MSTARTCFVHIGMMKTGSTTIQTAFHGYDDGRLMYFPSDTKNHTGLLRNVAKKNPKPLLRVIGSGITDEQFREIVEQQRRQFRDTLASTDRDLIISSEELTAGFVAQDLRRLVDILREHVDTLTVIGYVRGPIGYMNSIVQQRTKLLEIDLDMSRFYPGYRERFEPWLDLVGREHAQIVRFSPDAFHDGDLLRDFAWRTGADFDRLDRSRPQMNRSLSAEAFAVLFMYRRARGTPRLNPTLAKHNQRVLTLLQGFGERRFTLDPDQCRAEIERNRADIDWIESLMGSAFDEPEPPADALVVATEDDLRQLAEANVPALREYLRERQVGKIGRRAGLVELLDAAYRLPPAP